MPLPSSNEFYQASKAARENYLAAKNKDKTKKINPERLQLIALLEIIHQHIDEIKQNNPQLPEEELQEICFGAWIFGIESIQPQYKLLDPEYKKGLIFNSGSTLYTIYLEELKKIGLDYKTLDDQCKLISLEKFYNFIFGEKQNDALILSLENIIIDNKSVKQKSIECLQNLLKHMYEAINNIEHGIPAEETFSHHMSNMDEEYKECKEEIKKNQSYVASFFSMFSSENPNRKFYEQLCKAIASIHLGDKDVPEDELSRSHNIKIGLLLYFKYTIENESWRGYRATSSGFYNACRKILNCQDVDNLTDRQKALAIAVLQTFLRDQRERQYLEDFGRKHFGKDNLLKSIDLKFNQCDPELTTLMNFFLNNQNRSKWPLTNAMYNLGKNVGSILGFGTGWASGLGASETNYFLRPKLTLSEGMAKVGTTIVGNAGSHFGFLAAAYTISTTTAYTLALILQETGKLFGGATLAAITLPVEFSFHGIQFAGQYFFDLYKKVNPELLKNVNPNVVACILRLPPETYPEEKQHRIEYITNTRVAPESDDTPNNLYALKK